MSDAYVECMVARKPSVPMMILKYVLIIFAVLAGLIGLIFNPFFLLGAGALAAGVYFVSLNADIEYEYLYLDKEITVDKVLNKTRRKRYKVYEFDKIEIMAPMNSYHLDDYKNRNFKVIDISSGIEQKPELRYVFYYNGLEKVVFEPDASFVKMCKNAAPRKVYTD